MVLRAWCNPLRCLDKPVPHGLLSDGPPSRFGLIFRLAQFRQITIRQLQPTIAAMFPYLVLGYR